MNPYLRIAQKPKNTLYFYTKEVLEGQWPEMEPASYTKPIITAEVIEEQIETKGDTTSAMVHIGIFFNNEFMFSVGGEKWLSAINGVLEWAPSTLEYWPSGHYRMQPQGMHREGMPSITWITWTEKELLKIQNPLEFREKLGEGGGGLHSADTLLEMFDEKYIWLKVDEQIGNEIKSGIESAYHSWEPPLPDSHSDKGSSAIARTLLPANGRVAANMQLIECPASLGGHVKIAYALERHSDGSVSLVFATDMLRDSSSAQGPRNLNIYFSVADAVSAAFLLCGVRREELTSMSKYREIVRQVTDSINEYLKK